MSVERVLKRTTLNARTSRISTHENNTFILNVDRIFISNDRIFIFQIIFGHFPKLAQFING